jgi:hypothetical protein
MTTEEGIRNVNRISKVAITAGNVGRFGADAFTEVEESWA